MGVAITVAILRYRALLTNWGIMGPSNAPARYEFEFSLLIKFHALYLHVSEWVEGC